MARSFVSASSQYLENANAVISSYPFTTACWFNSDSATANQPLMAVSDNTTNNRWLLRLAGDAAGDPIRFISTAAGTNRAADTSTGYSVNTWHHAIAIGASDTDRRVYIDGGSEGQNVISNTPAGLSITHIGNRGDELTDFMSGLIAEAAIWNVALSADDRAALAKGVSPLHVRPDALVAYWPLIGRHDPEQDRVGGFAMTLNNAPTQAAHTRIHKPYRKTGQLLSTGAGFTVTMAAVAVAVVTRGALSIGKVAAPTVIASAAQTVAVSLSASVTAIVTALQSILSSLITGSVIGAAGTFLSGPSRWGMRKRTWRPRR